MEEWISIGKKNTMESVFLQSHMELEGWKGYSCTACPSGNKLSPIPVSQLIFMDPRQPVYSVCAFQKEMFYIISVVTDDDS